MNETECSVSETLESLGSGCMHLGRGAVLLGAVLRRALLEVHPPLSELHGSQKRTSERARRRSTAMRCRSLPCLPWNVSVSHHLHQGSPNLSDRH